MELFPEERSSDNLLQQDGEAFYYGSVFTETEAAELFQNFEKSIPWKSDIVKMFGKTLVTKRQVAWFADHGISYRYSGETKLAEIWSEELLKVKTKVEILTGAKYNACLANLYHGGDEGMSWHADNEKSMIEDSSVASVSLGAERKFSFKHRESKDTVSIILEAGSVLDMRGQTQRFWLHQLPKTKRVTEPRINLTFRLMKTN